MSATVSPAARPTPTATRSPATSIRMQPATYITGVGAALPERVLGNLELTQRMPWLDVSPDWIAEHTGIEQRHVAAPGQQAVDLALPAALQALQQAQCDVDEIDLVLLATNSSEFVYPAGAALLQEHLAAATGRPMAKAAALDLQQGCASFVAAIVLATSMVQSGHCQRVLVTGAEVVTRMLDWSEKNCVLLGDGACACVVSSELPPAPRPLALQVLGSFLRTIPDRESIYQHGVLDPRNDPIQHIDYAERQGGRLRGGDLYARLQPTGRSGLFHMDGRKVYRFVRRMVASSGYLEVMNRSGLADAEEQGRIAEHLAAEATCLSALGDPFLDRLGAKVDRLVVHGANMVLDQELADQMHIPYERMALALQDTGNTSAASVGIALARLMAGELRYATIAKRDASGQIQKPAQQVRVMPLQSGMTALLLSFGAGTSWNYVMTRAV